MSDAPAARMDGRTVLVTGATRGIGLETARDLARRGARVVLGVRDGARGGAVADQIAREGGRAELLPMDLASFASVRGAASFFSAAHPVLDVLVNNAGVALARRQTTADGHEKTWQTNFLSHFLLTMRLLPNLRRAERPRVVHVSSEGHRTGRLDWDNLELERGYGGFRAYANSKLAQVLFTRELARRQSEVSVNALHPGAIATGIWRDVPQPARWLIGLVLPSPRRGAAPVVRLASDPALDGVSGRYFDRFRESDVSARAADAASAERLWAVAGKATAERGET